jgi:hypothetical protein
VIGLLKPEDTPERDALLAHINSDDDGGSSAPAAASVPGRAEAGEAKVATTD